MDPVPPALEGRVLTTPLSALDACCLPTAATSGSSFPSLFTGSPAQNLSLQTSRGTPFNVAFMFLPLKGLQGGITSYSVLTQLLDWSLQIVPLFGPRPDFLSCFPYSLTHTVVSSLTDIPCAQAALGHLHGFAPIVVIF